MASLDTTPVRELSDPELRRRLLALGYDVPVSVNRDFLVMKLEKASAGGGGGKASKRHSMGVTPSSSPVPNANTARKRKSIAVTPMSNSNARSYQNNISPPPMSSPSPPPSTMSTPSPHYSSSSSIATPSTPSPFVSRLNTPSPPSSPVNNGESASHSPRYMNYYNMFKSAGGGDSGMGGDAGGGGAYGYGYNRSIRYSAGGFSPVTSVAPPSRAERNGYAAGGSGTLAGVESDWCGSHYVSKILLVAFISFFFIIGTLYIRQHIIGTNIDSRALPGSAGSSDGGKGKEIPVPPPPPPKKVEPLPPSLSKMIFPICGLPDVNIAACIPKDVVKNSRSMFNTLKEELTQRAKLKGCRDVREVVTLNQAKAIILKFTNLRKAEDVESAFRGMLLLVTENPRAGLSLTSEPFKEKGIASTDVDSLDFDQTTVAATNVNPDFICASMEFLTSAALLIALAVGGFTAGYLSWLGFMYYRRVKKSEENEIFQLVDKVQEILFRQYELSQTSQGTGTPTTAFLAVNHIRDELVPPKERQKKDALWNKVVDYISNHESRIREEIQHISGEEFKVWRWLPSASPLTAKRFSTANHSKHSRYSMPAGSSPTTSTPVASSSQPAAAPKISHLRNSLYPNLNDMGRDEDDDLLGEDGMSEDANSNNKWQGQAFETCEGSPNALPSTPTTCLKIRHMFTDRDATVKDKHRIDKEILSKCRDSCILHIGIDTTSVEGCVYIRCLTKDDARNAFKALHGWWFDGHLLSVKFLREERYFSRFPEAKQLKEPLQLSRYN